MGNPIAGIDFTHISSRFTDYVISVKCNSYAIPIRFTFGSGRGYLTVLCSGVTFCKLKKCMIVVLTADTVKMILTLQNETFTAKLFYVAKC